MALFYAASEQGDYKAANAARKLAYTETKEQEKPKNNQTAKTESSPDFFGEALKRFETGKEQSASETIRHENISYNENDKKTDTEQVDSYPVLDKENVMSLISPAYEASKELTEHIKTGFDDYDGNIFFDIITAGTTVLRLNPITRKAATRSKYILRQIWKAGADLYLRGYKGYDFSADLLEHSLQENPNDLVFYDDSRVADIIRSDNNFLKKVDGLTKKIENKIPFNDTDRQHKFDVGDMYYSIHGCNLEITNINYNDDGTKDISVHISDNYDYTKIWTMMDGKGISLGSIANDAGTVSTWLDAINSYKVDIYLTLRR